MKVRCKLCEFEQKGFCLKKKRAGKPVKIKVNKSRSCSLYVEDARKVLEQFRKQEAHRAVLKRQGLQKVQLAAALAKLKESGSKGFDTSVVRGDKDVG